MGDSNPGKVFTLPNKFPGIPFSGCIKSPPNPAKSAAFFENLDSAASLSPEQKRIKAKKLLRIALLQLQLKPSLRMFHPPLDLGPRFS